MLSTEWATWTTTTHCLYTLSAELQTLLASNECRYLLINFGCGISVRDFCCDINTYHLFLTQGTIGDSILIHHYQSVHQARIS
jgi:hypothetical protein